VAKIILVHGIDQQDEESDHLRDVWLEAIRRGLNMPLEEGLDFEATLFGVLCASEDMKEGTRAFMEKRKAEFRGR